MVNNWNNNKKLLGGDWKHGILNDFPYIGDLEYSTPILGSLHIVSYSYLVFMTFHILGIIVPFDELHHVSEGLAATTNQVILVGILTISPCFTMICSWYLVVWLVGCKPSSK